MKTKTAVHNRNLILSERQVRIRYQKRSYFLMAILFFVLVAILLYFMRIQIISPCPENGCRVEMVYAKSDLTIQEQVLIGGVREFGLENAQSLLNIVERESTFKPTATNPTSGACGLFQFLPCSKLQCELTDIDCQVREGLEYIRNRYGTPNKAWEFWERNGWY